MVASPSEILFEPRIAATGNKERLIGWLLLIWWSLYIYFAILPNGVQWDEAAGATESGSASQRFLLFGMAMIVVPFVPNTIVKLRRSFPIELLALILYLGWSGLSVVWSDVPMLTLRRYGALALLCFSCVVLGCGYYGRDPRGGERFLRHVSRAAVVAVLVSLATTANELSLGNLLTPEWRSSLTQRGPELIFVCCYGLTAITSFGLSSVRHVATALLLLLPPLLFKARSVTAYALIGTAAILWQIHRRLIIGSLILAIIAAPSVVFLLVNTGNAAPGSSFGDLVSRNEDRDLLLSFTGRVPLWNCILPLAEERPVIGYGFGAFWSPERLESLWNCAGWTAVFAHNGFLDEVLGTGLIGLSLLMTFWLLALRRCFVLARSGGQFARLATVGAVWIVLLLLCNTLDTIFQFNCKAPFYFSLSLYAVLAGCQDAAASREARF